GQRAVFGQVRTDFHGWGEGASSSYSAALHWPELSLEMPVEGLVGALSPEGAMKIAQARYAFRPTGVLNAHVSLRSTPKGPDVEVRLDEIRRASLELFGRRVDLVDAIGSIGISAPGGLTSTS